MARPAVHDAASMLGILQFAPCITYSRPSGLVVGSSFSALVTIRVAFRTTFSKYIDCDTVSSIFHNQNNSW